MELCNVNSNAVNSNNVITERRSLYMAALKGDWKSIEDMPRIQRRISKIKMLETTLHIAAAANKEYFVEKLLCWMTSNETAENVDENMIGTTPTAENVIGTTPTDENVAGIVTGASLTADDEILNSCLTIAATVGNVNIANKIKQKLRIDRTPVNSLSMASFSGHSQMVQFLYRTTNWVGDEGKAEIFIDCVKNDLYGQARRMLNDHLNLAGDRNNIKDALRVLANKPSAFVSASQPGMFRNLINILFSGLKKKTSKQFEANVLFEKCLQAYESDVERFIDIPDMSDVLFDAAKVGNIEFLIKLIHFDFDLLWKYQKEKTIFHLAVEKRQESIFSLLHELGSVGGIIVSRTNETPCSNILYLAAKMAPQEKLNSISGAAFQMRREILWFKEVEKVVSLEFKEKKNAEGDTPYALFVKEHEGLRKEAEKWMIGTANYSMVVATLIGSIMFSGQLADGLNQNPHIFLAFTVSTAISLFGSSTSLIMFLSILTSRFSYDDFLISLPIRLMIGVISLYISIVAMMVAFATTFWLKNYNRDAKYVVIVLCAFVPIIDVLLRYRLVFDVVQSIFFRFRPRHRLLHKEVSYAPVLDPSPSSLRISTMS